MNNKYGHLAALFTVFIWGTTFISTKVLLDAFKPIEILFFRFLIALILLAVIYPKRLIVEEKKRELLFMAAGLCGVTLYYLFENIALTFTMAGNVSVILSAAPFFTAIIAKIVFKNSEKLKISFFVGFAMAMIGICLISFGDGNIAINPLGDLLALGAAIIWAFYSVITKKISEFGYNTIQVTRRIFFYGVIFMLPFLVIFDFNLGIERFANKINTANILFLSLGASALCFMTWNLAVKILGAVKTSVYIYMTPVVTIITAFIVLGERLTYLSALGVILTLLGLTVSEKRQKATKRILLNRE